MQGVYNDTWEIETNGGPHCASESTVGHKFMLNLVLVIIKGSINILHIVASPVADLCSRC